MFNHSQKNQYNFLMLFLSKKPCLSRLLKQTNISFSTIVRREMANSSISARNENFCFI